MTTTHKFTRGKHVVGGGWQGEAERARTSELQRHSRRYPDCPSSQTDFALRALRFVLGLQKRGHTAHQNSAQPLARTHSHTHTLTRTSHTHIMFLSPHGAPGTITGRCSRMCVHVYICMYMRFCVCACACSLSKGTYIYIYIYILGSLAEILLSLQIKRPIGRHRFRFERFDSNLSGRFDSFGLWRVCFPPCLVRPAGDCPCRD